MAYLKRWFVMLAVGGALLIGLSSCVVAPVELAPPGLVSRPTPGPSTASGHL